MSNFVCSSLKNITSLTAGSLLQEKIVHSFRYGHQLKPHYADLRDYTFKNPTWVAAFSEERKDELREKDDYLREYTHYDYPGRYKQGEQGQFFTRTRLDSLRRDANRGEGKQDDHSSCWIRAREIGFEKV